MKKIILIYVFFWPHLSSIALGNEIINTASEKSYPLDVHAHYTSLLIHNISEHEEFLKQKKIQKALLISTAYGVNGDLSNEADLDKVRQINNETASREPGCMSRSQQESKTHS